jgi:hypothetical protein
MAQEVGTSDDIRVQIVDFSVFRVTNFSKDVSDGENYTILLNHLKPDQCSKAPLQTSDLHQRAEQVSTVRSFSHLAS